MEIPMRYRFALLVPVFLLLSGFAGGFSAVHDLTGRWTLTVVTSNGTGTPTVEFKQEGEKLTGTYQSNAMGNRTLEGTVVGDTMRFELSMSGGGGEGVVLTYIARIVTADSLNGYVDFGGMGEAALTGTRVR
jgi:hypothetical protein